MLVKNIWRAQEGKVFITRCFPSDTTYAEYYTVDLNSRRIKEGSKKVGSFSFLDMRILVNIDIIWEFVSIQMLDNE